MAQMIQFSSALPISASVACYAGDDRGWGLTVNDKDPETGDLLPHDLTGVHTAQVRASAGSEEVLATITVNDSQAAVGTVSWHLTGEQTAALIEKGSETFEGQWDGQVVLTDGRTVTIARGPITCTLDVTRPGVVF